MKRLLLAAALVTLVTPALAMDESERWLRGWCSTAMAKICKVDAPARQVIIGMNVSGLDAPRMKANFKVRLSEGGPSMEDILCKAVIQEFVGVGLELEPDWRAVIIALNGSVVGSCPLTVQW